jgi:hypothetical protein
MGLLDELPSDWREKISERVDPKDIQKIEKTLRLPEKFVLKGMLSSKLFTFARLRA